MRVNETRLGLIVPSSNTNAEPLTADLLLGLNVVAMASRFALPTDLDAVIDETLLGPAADLIAASGVSCQAFHGTSGCWRGLNLDQELATRLHSRSGVPTTTASLAIVQGVLAVNATRVGLVFPGPPEVAEQIVREFRTVEIEVVSRSLPPTALSNQDISILPRSEIERLIVGANTPGVEAIVCIGTNLKSAYLVAELESRLSVPIVDSASATVWQLLSMAGISERPQGWGALVSSAQAM